MRAVLQHVFQLGRADGNLRLALPLRDIRLRRTVIRRKLRLANHYGVLHRNRWIDAIPGLFLLVFTDTIKQRDNGFQ
jgi:hypothetical protein